MTWDAITSYAEARGGFLLFQSNFMYFWLPKDAFAPADLEAFRELLARKVRPR